MKKEEKRQAAAGKPLPRVLPETAPYWQAAARHELVFQRCRECGRKIYFPRLACPGCLSGNLGWEKSAGRGTVYSFSVIHRALHDGFAPEVPYVYAVIELDEGVRMISNVIGANPVTVKVGMRVKVVFDDAAPRVSIPRFAPDAD